MIKNKFLKVALTATVLSSALTASASGANLRGVASTLKHIERPMKAAVAKAEKLFEQNGGQALTAAVSMLSGTAANPHLKTLEIGTDYHVDLVFKGATIDIATGAQTIDTTAANSRNPVTAALRGVTIKLIPIYVQGNAVVTSWECLTDADAYATTFVDHTVSPGSVSYITRSDLARGNPYLGNCVYLDNSSLTAL